MRDRHRVEIAVASAAMAQPKRVAFAIRHFGVDRLRVLDVGCGRGDYLEYFGPGSVGLDLNPAAAIERGLVARTWNFADGIPTDLRAQFDAVWCSNLFEHVLAPHQFLIDLRMATAPPGRLFLALPNTTRYSGRSWHGYLAADHINFFTPRTLECTLTRAGYQIDFLGSPSIPQLPLGVAARLGRVAPVLLAAATMIPDFQYPEKAHKRLVAGQIEWKGDASLGD
jgi:SAM-dependent methyltransferase